MFWKKNGNNLLFKIKKISSATFNFFFSSFKISHVNKQWIEGYDFALSEEKCSYFMIEKRYDMLPVKISKFKLAKIFNR